MSRRLLVLAAPVVLAALLLGCNGDSDAPNGGNDGPDAIEFELARDALYQELDSYGANIGFLPDDIRDDLLASCRALDEFAAGDDVDEICTAIEQAIADGDPGLIELVLNELAVLTAD
ncbi:MAG: hypothetical protein IIB87_03025 [Chloroflexi bacterium]|nr:hypothetical protein [Chloroflexota bacterium]